MHLYNIDSPNTSLTFWVLTRLFEALILLSAPYMRNYKFNPIKLSFLFSIFTLGIITLAMNNPLTLFIKEEGLTHLKIIFEYIIISILLLSIYITRKHIKEFHKNINDAITLSIILTILSELSFTMYTDIYGIMNVIGHVLKFLSFWILLQAIIKSSLKDPFSLMQKGASSYNAVPIPSVVVDEKGIIRQVNSAAMSYLQMSENTILGQSNHQVFHPKNLEVSECPICQAIEEKNYIQEYEIEDTRTHTFTEYSLSPIHSDLEQTQGLVQISVDTTQKRKLQRTMLEQYQLLQNIVNTVPIRIFWKNANGIYMGANNLFLQDAKLNSIEELIGKNDFEMIWSETDAQAYRDDDIYVMETDTPKLQFEETQTNDKGETIILSTSKVPLRNSNGEIIGILGTYEDISHKRNMEYQILQQAKTLQYQATHDTLTALPNRMLFHDRLEHAIKRAKRNHNSFALLFIDLDQFKQINDSLGHHAGDDVLKIIAKRLKNAIRETDTLARLGGDEFVIIADNNANIDDLSTLAQKIINTTTQNIMIKEQSVYLSSSIGICIYPQDSTNGENLLKYADAAMYKAKEEGRNNFQFYSKDMTIKAMRIVQIQSKLKDAIEHENFVVYYQPQVDAYNGTIIGLEALVRWPNKDGTLISPLDFIPLAEDTGLIVELDRIVMKKALTQIALWKQEGIFKGSISLNLAMKQLQKDDFISFLQELITTTKLAPQDIELEITEGGLMHKPEESIEKLNALKALNIKISIDDFGTGYSSLAYIKKLPISKIKIDKSFVRDIPEDHDDVSIVKAIIALSESLDLDILAEGVETKEQLNFMLEHGCRSIQGYFYSEPMSATQTKKFLESF